MTSLIPTAEGFGSLHGLRVIEIATSVAGPVAGSLLGDLGAEVIKVERVGSGDDTRTWNPPAWNGVSTAFLMLNRNKSSIELDWTEPRGKQILEDLIRSADIVVQNLRPGALAKAGFTWDRLQELSPRLVYCEMTGYGPAGPRAGEPAYDPLLQAYAGIVAMMPDTGEGPVRVPLSILDKGTAMWAVIGIQEALRRAERDNRAVKVNVSLLNTALEWVSGGITNYFAGNGPSRNLGSGFPGVVPYGAFPTSDGHIFIAAGAQRLWIKLIEAIGHPELQQREGFDSNEARSANRPVVVEALSAITRTFARDDLHAILHAAGVPNAPVRRSFELIDDPQVAAIGGIVDLPHPQVPDFKVVQMPVQVDGENLRQQMAPPMLGADTERILASLGYDQTQVRTLIDEGVVGVTEAG